VVAVADRSILLFLHHKETELEEIRGKTRVSYDAEGIASIVVDQFEDFAHTEALMETQLASADEGCNLAGYHKNLFHSSYPT
jgi:hypothetical protein